MDAAVYYGLRHPGLLPLVEELWGSDPKTASYGPPPAEGLDADRVDLLKAHGVPDDTSTWMWAYEALSLAERCLGAMRLGFRLCDFVEWKCSGEPPNLVVNSEFSEPRLFKEAKFGTRIAEADYERLEGCIIWKTDEGKYVSPLWEYLHWAADCVEKQNDVYACLGNIGRGIDAAVLAHDPSYDPADTGRVRLTPTRLFEAGGAVVRLRLKVELEATVLHGFEAQRSKAERAEKSGAASQDARRRRMESLLTQMESLVRTNPILPQIDPLETARLAQKAAAETDPRLWKQGSGQIEEYLGEIRREEAGAALKQRYDAIFPASRKPPKP